MTADEVLALSQRIQDALDGNPWVITDLDTGNRMDAINAAATRLQQLISRSVEDTIPPGWLLSIQAAFDPVVATVESYVDPNRPDELALDVGWSEIERLWISISPLVTLGIPEDSVSEDAASFRRSAGQMVRRLADQVDEVQRQAEAVRGELETARSERDAAIEQLRSQLTGQEQKIAEQAARMDAVIAEHQSQFSEAQQRHREAFDAAIDGFRSDLGSTLSETTKSAEERAAREQAQAEAVLEDLKELERKATVNYNTIGNAATAGHYQTDADNEKKQANLWRWLAVVGFAIVAIATIAELGFSGGSLEWAETRSRLPAILAFGAFAAYAVAESAQHRKAERLSRTREVELSSIDPFLALIEDQSEAEQIKLDFARRVFVEGLDARRDSMNESANQNSDSVDQRE